jgi:hypothetical protein
MALHLARSDGGIGGREKGDDQMMFSIILFCIVNNSIVSRWKSKIEGLTAHKLYLLCSFPVGNREEEKKEERKDDPF